MKSMTLLFGLISAPMISLSGNCHAVESSRPLAPQESPRFSLMYLQDTAKKIETSTYQLFLASTIYRDQAKTGIMTKDKCQFLTDPEIVSLPIQLQEDFTEVVNIAIKHGLVDKNEAENRLEFFKEMSGSTYRNIIYTVFLCAFHHH